MPKGLFANSYSRLLLTLCLGSSTLVFAKPKTNQILVPDSFDLGGGGASLTLATQEEILLSNPALLPNGGKFFRWMGTKFSLIVDKDSVDLAQELVNQSGGGGNGEEAASSDAEGGDASTKFNEYLDKSVHVGMVNTTSLLTKYFGFSIFGSAEADFKGYPVGNVEEGTGLPQVVIGTEAYSGAALSTASRILPWLSLGVTGKYFMVSHTSLSLQLADLADPELAETLTSDIQTVIVDSLEPYQGPSAMVGTLAFFQGRYVDFRAATVVDNVGGAPLKAGSRELILPQMIHGGLGMTFHTNSDAIHFSVDYRDIQNAYQQPMFKRVYAGTKIMLRRTLGLSAGVYHGVPTYGFNLDLWFFRIAGAVYTREYGDSPGFDSRRLYMLTFATGMTL